MINPCVFLLWPSLETVSLVVLFETYGVSSPAVLVGTLSPTSSLTDPLVVAVTVGVW